MKEEKSDNMRRFNVKFDWVIKNENGDIVKENKVDKDIYFSEEQGD